MSAKYWRHDEVCALLCGACAHGVKNAVYQCGSTSPASQRFTHYLNGQRVPCLASAFRVRAAREAISPEPDALHKRVEAAVAEIAEFQNGRQDGSYHLTADNALALYRDMILAHVRPAHDALLAACEKMIASLGAGGLFQARCVCCCRAGRRRGGRMSRISREPLPSEWCRIQFGDGSPDVEVRVRPGGAVTLSRPPPPFVITVPESTSTADLKAMRDRWRRRYQHA